MLSGRIRTFIWIVGSLVLGAVFLAIAFWPSGTDEWDAMSSRIDQLKAEARSRRFPRTVLKGEAQPGNAWEEYQFALNDAAKWSEAEDAALSAYIQQGGAKVDRAKVERLVAERENAIEHLRRGAQRADGQYFYDWDKVGHMTTPNLRDARRLVNVAVAQAKIWAHSGRWQDAAELLLDASAFSRDHATNATPAPSLTGFAMYEITLAQLSQLIQSGKLTQKQLADLAKKLETLDHDFPAMSPTLSNNTMALGIYSQKAADGGVMGEEWWATARAAGWRFAMGPQGVMRDAYETQEAFMKRFVKFDEMSFEAVKKEADSISRDASASTNEIVRFITPNLLHMVTVQRQALAQLRLVRAGTIFLSTGTTPALADPFGDKLLYKQQGRTLKIWSIGSDGKNNDGTAGTTKREDLVLEISR